MGQQQLILIVLSTIVVGVAIAVGLLIFATDRTMAERDALMEDLNTLVANARAFCMRPSNMGGGGDKFFGYKIPSRMLENENGTFVSKYIDDNTLELYAYSIDDIDNYIKATINTKSVKVDWTFYKDFKDIE
jgi:hypothetical protein